MTDREHLAKRVYEAMRFALWAAGEGIGTARCEPTDDPEDFLYDYSLAVGIDDWDGLPAVARDAILNAVGGSSKP
ncbi:MAG: hypothetical protein NVS3B5_21150 [Sphingomicrobium sp.]